MQYSDKIVEITKTHTRTPDIHKLYYASFENALQPAVICDHFLSF